MARVATVAFTRYDSDPRVRRMAEALAAEGHDVNAIVLREPGKPKLRKLEGVSVRGVQIGQHRGSNILAYLAQYVVFVAVAAVHLCRLHIQSKIDVVHANNMPDFVVFAALPVKLFGAQVILDVHDPMPELYEAKFGAGPTHPAVRVVSLVERFSVSFADRVISVHDVQMEALLGRGAAESKFTVVQNVADPRYFPIGAAETSTRQGSKVVYHGLISERLGVDVLVRAMAKVAEEMPEASLLIIGDGDAAPQVEDLIDKLALDEIVQFRRGFVPVDELLADLVLADVGVIPARANAFTKHMLPTKLLEYVTLGIPVVSTELISVRRYFDERQIKYVASDDPVAMAKAIVELLRSPELRESFSTEAARFLEEHGWPEERSKYVALVEELAGEL